jgi:Transposase DNA-binding
MRALVTTIPADTSWAVTAVAEADVGDARRTQRLVELATVLAQRPRASLPPACGHRAMVKAAYRVFENAALDPQALLARPGLATSARRASGPRVLAVQDTTALDWTAHPATTGLGPRAHPAQQGLLVHTPLALTPERLPLGRLAPQVWARAAAALGTRATRTQRPSADNERPKWLPRVAAVSEAPARCPQTRFVGIGDRDADGYALLVQERPSGVDLVVRAAWNRRVAQAARDLWTKVAAPPGVATLTVRVPRRGRQPARQAPRNVRWWLVLRGPPTHRHAAKLPTGAGWAGQALPEQPPAGGAPIAWLLLTPCGVHTAQDAVERVAW